MVQNAYAYKFMFEASPSLVSCFKHLFVKLVMYHRLLQGNASLACTTHQYNYETIQKSLSFCDNFEKKVCIMGANDNSYGFETKYQFLSFCLFRWFLKMIYNSFNRNEGTIEIKLSCLDFIRQKDLWEASLVARWFFFPKLDDFCCCILCMMRLDYQQDLKVLPFVEKFGISLGYTTTSHLVVNSGTPLIVQLTMSRQ